MNNETQELLKEVKIAVFNAIWKIGDNEEAVKMIVKAITEGIEVALGDNDAVESVLKDLSYWSQPWINPYYEDQEEQ